MLLLALDTATAASTVAVGDGSAEPAELTEVVGNRHAERTAAQIAQVLSEAGTTASQLDLIVVGIGPGPYTSTRAGVVLARSFGLALGIPVVGYCTLDVIAAEVSGVAADGSHPAATAGREGFGVATDARRKEIYWASYSAAGIRETGPRVGRPDSVLDPPGVPRGWAGNGLDRFPEIEEEQGIVRLAPRFPSAAVLIDCVRRILEDGDGPSESLARPMARLGAADALAQLGGLDDRHGDGGVARIPAGALLPAVPAYLRRPDARPPTLAGASR